MDLRTFLASAERGASASIARSLRVHPVMVSQWASGLKAIPVERCTAIEQATKGVVRRWHLRPDDWHRIWPELVGTEGSPVLPEEPAAVAVSDTKPEPRYFHLGDHRGLAMNTFRAIRESLGVTQAEMGAVLGVSQSNVSFYEKGQTVPPTVAAKLIEFSRSKGKVLSYDDVYRVETSDPSAGPETCAQAVCAPGAADSRLAGTDQPRNFHLGDPRGLACETAAQLVERRKD